VRRAGRTDQDWLQDCLQVHSHILHLIQSKNTVIDSRLVRGSPPEHQILPAKRCRVLYTVIEGKPVTVVHFQKAWYAPVDQISISKGMESEDQLLRMTEDVDPVLWAKLRTNGNPSGRDFMLLARLGEDFNAKTNVPIIQTFSPKADPVGLPPSSSPPAGIKKSSLNPNAKAPLLKPSAKDN